MIEAIVWDIGGVLIEDVNIDKLWKNSRKSIQIRNEFGEGKLNTKQFISKGSKLLKKSKKQFISNYKKIYSSFNKINNTIKIYKNIKLDRYIFSDTNPIREYLIKEKTRDIFNLAKKVFLSHKIKMRKGNIKSYKYIIKKIGLEPEKILFIDNSEKNILLAKKAGINAILYTNSEKLKKDLNRLL